MDNNPIDYKDDNLVDTKEYHYILRSRCSLCISNKDILVVVKLCWFTAGLRKKSESLKVIWQKAKTSEWEGAHIIVKNLNKQLCAKAVWNKLGRREARSSYERLHLRGRQFWELDVILWCKVSILRHNLVKYILGDALGTQAFHPQCQPPIYAVSTDLPHGKAYLQ